MGWYDAGVDVNVKGEGKVEDKEPVHLISGLQRGPARAALTASQETQLHLVISTDIYKIYPILLHLWRFYLVKM